MKKVGYKPEKSIKHVMHVTLLLQASKFFYIGYDLLRSSCFL